MVNHECFLELWDSSLHEMDYTQQSLVGAQPGQVIDSKLAIPCIGNFLFTSWNVSLQMFAETWTWNVSRLKWSWHSWLCLLASRLGRASVWRLLTTANFFPVIGLSGQLRQNCRLSSSIYRLFCSLKHFSLFSWNFFPTWTRSDLVVFPLFNHQKFSYHWFKSRLISVWAQPGLTAAAHKEAFDVALLFPFHLRAARAKVQSGENERLYGLFLRPSPIRDHTSRFTAKDPLEDHAQS